MQTVMTTNNAYDTILLVESWLRLDGIEVQKGVSA